MGTDSADCSAYFSAAVDVNGGELRVYRCAQGWYVKRGAAEARSRYLDEAFETVLGRPLDRDALRALLDMLDRELTAERDRTGKTASRVLH